MAVRSAAPRRGGWIGWLFVAGALGALAAWPFVNAHRDGAAVVPDAVITAAPVLRDDLTRDKQVAAFEANARRNAHDPLAARLLAGAYLQRFRERGDPGDVLRAKAMARRSLRDLGKFNAAAAMTLAAADYTEHDFRGALAAVDLAARMAGQSVQNPKGGIRAERINLLLELGEIPAAAALIARTPVPPREDGAMETTLARYDELTGHLDAARALIAKAATLQDEYASAPAESRAWYHVRAAELAFAAGDLGGARREVGVALDEFPPYPRALTLKAKIAWASRDWTTTRDAASASVAIVPSVEALGYLADAQRALGDRGGAQTSAGLIAAIARISALGPVNDRLVAVYWSDHHERPHEALQIALRELRLRDDAYTEDTIAWAAVAAGRWDLAGPAIRKALRYGIEDARVQYHAGVIFAHEGQRAQAEAAFERALARNPQFDPDGPADARRRLAAREGA